MKVDIKGNNPITGDDMKNIINGLNKEYEHFKSKNCRTSY